MSACKPINYLLALEEHGISYVHRFVGREPSGQSFNEMVLNYQNIPHNPFVESGAIMVSSLIKHGENASARFEHIMGTWRRATGDSSTVRFNNSVFLSQRDSSDRNFCLGYMMQEKEAYKYGNNKDLPPRKWKGRIDLANTLDLYSMCCAIEANAKDVACLAATLANGGICPISGERIFKHSYIRGALTLMLSCGMYDYSGKWAYTMGIPAKSSNSGIVMVVVPNFGGFAVYSPLLDKQNNSVKAVSFCKLLCNSMTLHILEIAMSNKESLVDEQENKYVDQKEEEEFIEEWSPIKVKQWVESFGQYFSQYGDSIMRNQITGSILMNSSASWTNADLEASIGMTNPDHQRIIFNELQKLREQNKVDNSPHPSNQKVL
eukprot:TRINITY_DN5633_c0_g1_i1.p1 TRINITY_DN5633_c0_g1~~TRINITY_DN5633_c0_g1_i1.p1  ORF type:complete len:377 (+),score=60.30 TRINITY_DN5633_c0_g1_i1:458-1588(+)